MYDLTKQTRTIRDALIAIESAYARKDKNDSFEQFIKKYHHSNTKVLDDLLPWQQEVLSALSSLYLAGYFDATNYIESLK